MATKVTPQASTTAVFLLIRLREAGGSEGLLCDTGAQTHDGDHENQNDEDHQAQGQGDIAATPRLGLRIGLVGGIAHDKSSSGFIPVRCSTSSVANKRVR